MPHSLRKICPHASAIGYPSCRWVRRSRSTRSPSSKTHPAESMDGKDLTSPPIKNNDYIPERREIPRCFSGLSATVCDRRAYARIRSALFSPIGGKPNSRAGKDFRQGVSSTGAIKLYNRDTEAVSPTFHYTGTRRANRLGGQKNEDRRLRHISNRASRITGTHILSIVDNFGIICRGKIRKSRRKAGNLYSWDRTEQACIGPDSCKDIKK